MECLPLSRGEIRLEPLQEFPKKTRWRVKRPQWWVYWWQPDPGVGWVEVEAEVKGGGREGGGEVSQCEVLIILVGYLDFFYYKDVWAYKKIHYLDLMTIKICIFATLFFLRCFGVDRRLLGFHPLLWILEAASALSCRTGALSCNHSNAVMPRGLMVILWSPLVPPDTYIVSLPVS